MNSMAGSGGAPFVGVAAGGIADAAAMEPICVDERKVRARGKDHILNQLSDTQLAKLYTYVQGRLAAGVIARDRRIQRYAKIDKLISTWQKLSPEDTKREAMEDNTGKNQALPMNLPILAASLSDFVSYFSEALAPISNPFFSADGDDSVKELLVKFNRDARARDYFGELSLTIRSLIKYNLGGLRLKWDDGRKFGKTIGDPGNHYVTTDLYNTLWDPSIRNPTELSTKGEWAATISLENRLELIKYAISGEWVNLEDIVSKGYDTSSRSQYYREPAVTAAMGDEGQDSKTSSQGGNQVNWASYGMGLATDLGPEVDGFEVVDIVIWLFPNQFGLMTVAEEQKLRDVGEDPDLWYEPWRVVIVGQNVVHAEPFMDREKLQQGERAELPFYLSFLTRDQLREAQRSFMELEKGFQRFGSAMFNIYIAGMRKNVWGQKVYDPTAIDPSQIKAGEVSGAIATKQPGRDVGTAVKDISTQSGVQEAMQAVGTALDMKDRFFPAQAVPSQVAGIDRAVKSQVSTVVQGATRSMRTVLRLIDSGLMLPSRMAGYRNLKMYDPEGIGQLTDEQVASLMGSGIESIEAERVSEILWQLLYAIIQNQEAMQVFDIPKMLAYLGRVGNLSVDLSSFAKQAPPPQQPPADQGAGPTPEELAAAATQAGGAA